MTPSPPYDAKFEWLAEDYAESAEFDLEACRHVADCDPADLPAGLMQILRDYYERSAAFRTRIEDALNERINTW